MRIFTLLLLAVLLADWVLADEATMQDGGLLNEFIIMAYWGPPPEETTLERYREIAGAGIEYLIPGNGTFDKESNLKAMDLAQQTGLKIMPIDMRLKLSVHKPGVGLDETVIRQIAQDYKNHPVLAGYFIKDEPSADLFPAIKSISDILHDEDPEHEPFINLLSSDATVDQLGVNKYAGYVRSYLKNVGPRLLCYDACPLRLGGKTAYEEWYGNLEIIREEALKAGVPFLVSIQSEGIRERLRVPNRAEILWQASTVLAYGAQGVGWFSYWTPQPEQGIEQMESAKQPRVEMRHNAMIGADGKRTKVYHYVSKANAFLKRAGNGLMGWENVAVARLKAGRMYKGGSLPVAVPEGELANVVIGTFEKDGVSRLVIANASCEEKAAFGLYILAEKEQVEVFASVSAAPLGGKDSMLEWHLAPGGSVVLDLK